MSPLLTGISVSSTSTLLSTPRALVTMFLRGERFGLFFCDEPLEDLFGDPGMVCGEGLDGPVSNEVEPAVSDMGDGEHALHGAMRRLQWYPSRHSQACSMTRDERPRSLHESRWQDDWLVQTPWHRRDRPAVNLRCRAASSQMRVDRSRLRGHWRPRRRCRRPCRHRRHRVRAGIGDKAILVVRPFEAGIGFGAMQSFEGQTTPPSGRKTLQAGTELAREFFRAPIAVRQFFL